RCLSEFRKPYVTYGLSQDCDYFATDLALKGSISEFTVWSRMDESTQTRSQKHEKLGTLRLKTPGSHNVLNALSCVAIARRMGLGFETIASGLSEFAGVQRRFQTIHNEDARKIRVVDDYGHHPTEIRTTVQTARATWSGRLIVVFQPHRYSRTKLCY